MLSTVVKNRLAHRFDNFQLPEQAGFRKVKQKTKVYNRLSGQRESLGFDRKICDNIVAAVPLDYWYIELLKPPLCQYILYIAQRLFHCGDA